MLFPWRTPLPVSVITLNSGINLSWTQTPVAAASGARLHWIVRSSVTPVNVLTIFITLTPRSVNSYKFGGVRTVRHRGCVSRWKWVSHQKIKQEGTCQTAPLEENLWFPSSNATCAERQAHNVYIKCHLHTENSVTGTTVLEVITGLFPALVTFQTWLGNRKRP